MIEGLYVHIPFCARRCHYCDFNTYEGLEDLKPAYTDALLQDLKLSASTEQLAGLKSIFFGGGTPSLMSGGQIGRIVAAAGRADIEITLEANPGTAEASKFADFRKAGVNRVSLGFQALQAGHLESLGRIHSSDESVAAWKMARSAGFENMSLDLMFGLPGQTMQEWQDSLNWALDLRPEHLSFYGLTLEPGTRFYHLHAQEQLQVPEEGLQADMYEFGIERLRQAGLGQYEISNFARPGRESVHNRLYWRNRPTLGLGAGAWSFLDGSRYSREKNPAKYIEALGSGHVPVAETEHLEGPQARGEAIYLGLRMLEGIDLGAWKAEQGHDLLQDYADEVKTLQNQGLIEIGQGRLRLSARGLPLANEVFQAFL